MFVLGLQGSPRKKGNSSFLLSEFMAEAQSLGAKTHVVEVDKQNIQPCKEYIVCEKKGFCPIDDDMKHEIYALLRRADVIVVASPVFFFNVTAQLKALIDRCQTFWARKYKFKLKDPNSKYRRGFMLAVGASRGKSLFDGIHLTAKYFFDAVDASYDGSLTYRGIESAGAIQKHPSAQQEVREAVRKALQPFMGRKKILFACRGNACRSQMAAAFAQANAGDRLDVYCGGSAPADQVNPVMLEAMHEKLIDMAFRNTQTVEAALAEGLPDIIVNMGCGEACPLVPGAARYDWDLPDPAGKSLDFMRDVRDRTEQRVIEFINTVT